MINQPLNKSKHIANSRSIKNYKNKSKEYLTKILSKSKPKRKYSKKILVT